MTPRGRSMVALPFVLAWAGFVYVRNAPLEIDPMPPSSEPCAAPPADADPPEGRRVSVGGYMVPAERSATGSRRFLITQLPLFGGLDSRLPAYRVVAGSCSAPVPYTSGRIRVAGRVHVERIGTGDETGVFYTVAVDSLTAVPETTSMFPPTVVGVAGMMAAASYAAGFSRRRARVRAGRCVGCGYDLRMTPARCPECGRAATPPNVLAGRDA